jgi:hypothetical protein
MTTKERVLAIRTECPEKPATEVARELGVSRERVRQILNELKLPTKFASVHPCKQCGQSRPYNKYYCSEECKTARRSHYRQTYTCKQCGRPFQLRPKYVEWHRNHGHPHIASWCSNRCQGLYLYRTTEGLGKQNSRKTHCKYGHEFTPANTYRKHRGGRQCKACALAYQANYRKLAIQASQ